MNWAIWSTTDEYTGYSRTHVIEQSLGAVFNKEHDVSGNDDAGALIPSHIMKLKEIHRTSTFAWSPSASLPLLATGTVAGALDESFSNESQLEIWAPDFLDNSEFDLGVEGQHGPKGHVIDTARSVCHDSSSPGSDLGTGSTDWHGAMAT